MANSQIFIENTKNAFILIISLVSILYLQLLVRFQRSILASNLECQLTEQGEKQVMMETLVSVKVSYIRRPGGINS